MIRLTAREKLKAVKEALVQGRSLKEVSRKYSCTRQSLYLWTKQFKKSPKLLVNHYPRGRNHHRCLPFSIEKQILDLVVGNPEFSVRQVAGKLARLGSKVSVHGVYNVFLKHNLQTRELRERFCDKQPLKTVFAHKLAPAHRVRVIEEYLVEGRQISAVCKQFSISRPTFYKWLGRYQGAAVPTPGESKPFDITQDRPTPGVLEALVRRYKRGYEHHRAIGQEAREAILAIVRASPDYSVHKIQQVAPTIDGKPIAGHHAIQNLLTRENLNTVARRREYASGYITQPKVAVAPQYVPEMPLYRWRMLLAPFVTIPKLLVARPRAGFSLLALVSLPLLVFSLWIRVIIGAPPGTSIVGLVFASVALFFGLFFFVYSSKYYISILMVLKLAQGGGSESEGQSVKSNTQKEGKL